MAVHWTITFRPLRTNDTYTVNIYDSGYSGTPVRLKGGAQPFSTQEDDDDDMFRPVRTQSGYLRIFDDGKDADGNAFNWKSMLPTTDTDRPVTLTNAAGTVLWQGFMQAQNFGGELYGNPQEREYPVQCALTVTEGTDVDYEQTAIRNFAYLLRQVLAAIPTLDITTIMVQGGSDARQWLLTKIDWQNFVSEDGDGNLTARYNLFTCLEDMCRFWGWTARTYRQTLFLTCADESSATTFLKLTRAELATLAGGETAGTTGETFTGVTIGSIFASTSNNDYRLRGPNKAVVRADGNAANEYLAGITDESLADDMEALGWGPYVTEDDVIWAHTNDMASFTKPLMAGSSRTGYGSFNLLKVNQNSDLTDQSVYSVINIKKSFSSATADAYVTLQTIYHHAYSDGKLQLHGTTFRKGVKYEDVKKEGNKYGQKNMYMRLGIGATRATAKWWDGQAWSSSETAFLASIGNKDDIFRSVYITTGHGTTTTWRDYITVDIALSGILFIEFLGTADLDEISGERQFDIEAFTVTFARETRYRTNSSTTSTATGNFGGRAEYINVERNDIREYKSMSASSVRMEWNADCIFASDNNMSFGFGVLINPDGSYFTGYGYGGGALVQPEQHLADRVTAYWASAKRKIDTEVRSDALGAVSPQSTASLDGTTFYPVAIGNEWRDDVTRLTLVEI